MREVDPQLHNSPYQRWKVVMGAAKPKLSLLERIYGKFREIRGNRIIRERKNKNLAS